MKLKELNTPFEKKRMLAYGRDGNTAVRRYIEVQRITGNLYKSRTEIVGWGYEQCFGCTSSFPVVLPDLISGIFPFSGKEPWRTWSRTIPQTGWTLRSILSKQRTGRRRTAALSAIP